MNKSYIKRFQIWFSCQNGEKSSKTVTVWQLYRCWEVCGARSNNLGAQSSSKKAGLFRPSTHPHLQWENKTSGTWNCIYFFVFSSRHSTASGRKKAQRYKIMWTRGGMVHSQRNRLCTAHAKNVEPTFCNKVLSWYGRPNPEDRINRKPEDRIYDWRTE